MPEQKGKRRNRPGNRTRQTRGTTALASAERPQVSSPAAQKPSSVPARRRGFMQLPLWGNLVMGAVIVIFGLYLFLSAPKSEPAAQRIIFFALYVLLSGVYWAKAYRQIRERRVNSGP